MKTLYGHRESLAASAFRGTVRSFLGRDVAQRFEQALLGESGGEAKDAGDTVGLLRFAEEFGREAAAVEIAAQRWLLPWFTEDQVFALVAFAGSVRKYRSTFGEPRPAATWSALAAA